MAKFTELEKNRLKEEIKEISHRLFIDKGFKSTSLEDITSSVGIAKSSFYIFYESKEMLYMELLGMEGEEIEDKIWPKVKAAKNIHLAIKVYLNEMTHELESKILTQRLIYDLDEYKLVARKLNPGYVASKTLISIVSLMEFIKEHQATNEIIGEDPSVIAGTLRATLLIGSQKRDLQNYNYEMVRELLFEAVTNQIRNSL